MENLELINKRHMGKHSAQLFRDERGTQINTDTQGIAFIYL